MDQRAAMWLCPRRASRCCSHPRVTTGQGQPTSAPLRPSSITLTALPPSPVGPPPGRSPAGVRLEDLPPQRRAPGRPSSPPPLCVKTTRENLSLLITCCVKRATRRSKRDCPFSDPWRLCASVRQRSPTNTRSMQVEANSSCPQLRGPALRTARADRFGATVQPAAQIPHPHDPLREFAVSALEDVGLPSLEWWWAEPWRPAEWEYA